MVASLDVAATVPARPLATIEPNQSQATIMKMLLEAGVHFGHQTKRWNPKMRPYIFTERNGIHIIDLAQTVSGLEAATMFVEELAAQGGRMLFVGTKKQAQDVISEESVRCGQFYVNRRWPGGLLTNFVTIRTRLRHLADLEAQKARGEFEMRTKKEASKLNEEIRKLTEVLGGIKIMQDLPSAMFVVDPHKERIAMLEAIRLEIPVLAIGDTNANPDEIDYVIPGNDDAIRSIKIITARLADAFIEGANRREATRAEQMMSDEEQNRGRGGRDGGRGGRDGGRGADRNDRGGRDGGDRGGQRRNDNAPQASGGDATATQGGGERRPQGERPPRPQGERQPRPQAQTGDATATQGGERPQGEPRRERQPRPQAPAAGDATATQGGERPQGEPRRERQPRPQASASGDAPTQQTGEQTAAPAQQTGERTERPRRERSTAPRPTNAPAPAPTDSESGSES